MILEMNVIDYDKKILNQFQYEYDQDTTIYDLITTMDIMPFQIERYDLFYSYYDSSEGIDYAFVKYILNKNGNYEWLIPIEECKLVDFIEFYHIDTLRIYQRLGGIGAAVGGPDFDWIVILLMLEHAYLYGDKVLRVLEMASFSKKAIESIRRKIHTTFLNPEKKIPKNIVDEAILQKDYWAVADFAFRFDVDKESVPFILEWYGYIYDQKQQLYFFNQSMHDKHEKKYQDKLEKFRREHAISIRDENN